MSTRTVVAEEGCSCSAASDATSLNAVNRRGRTITVRIECSAPANADGVVSGAVLVTEDDVRST